MQNFLGVPKTFVAGDATVWYTDPIPGINIDTGQVITMQPPNFTLSFAFRGASYFDVTAVADGVRFKSIIDSATSAELTAGVCSWQAYVTDLSGDRTTIGNGQTLILTNLALATTAPLSQVQVLQAQLDRVNAAIDALLSGKPIKEYEINGRRIQYLPLPDLTALRETLKKDLYRATIAESAANGKNKRRHYIQFNNPGGRA